MIVAPSRSPNVQGHTPPDSLYHSTAGKGPGACAAFSATKLARIIDEQCLSRGVLLSYPLPSLHKRWSANSSTRNAGRVRALQGAQGVAQPFSVVCSVRILLVHLFGPSVRPEKRHSGDLKNLQRSWWRRGATTPEAARCVIPAALRGAPYGNLR